MRLVKQASATCAMLTPRCAAIGSIASMTAIRLLEARRLMVSDLADVSEAAYQAGYESPSKFSREYTRSFGMAPKRDAMNFKALLALATTR